MTPGRQFGMLPLVLGLLALAAWYCGSALWTGFWADWNEFPAGSHCIVAQPVWGVSDIAIFSEIEKATEIRDAFGVQELTTKGMAIQIPAGTPVLALDKDFDWTNLAQYRRVRILGGSSAGKAMWIRKDGLRPTVHYKDGDDQYDIPANREADFLSDHPKAVKQ
jgi:hypothetical protein